MTVKRILADGCPFERNCQDGAVEGVDLVVMGSYGGAFGGVEKIFSAAPRKKSSDRRLSGAHGAPADQTRKTTRGENA